MLYFYTPWKRQKSPDFLEFPGDIAMENLLKMG